MPLPYNQAPTLGGFQAPSIAQPIHYEPPNLDSVFNTVIQARLAHNQMQLQQQQIDKARFEQSLGALQTGIDPQALAAHPEAIGQAFGQSQPPGQPGAPQSGQQQESPLVQALKAYSNRMGGMQALQRGKEQSEIYKNVGAGGEGMAALQALGLQPPQISGLPQSQTGNPQGGDMVGNVTRSIQSSQMSPDQLGNLGRGALPNAIRLGAMNQLTQQGTNIRQLQASADATAAGQKNKATSVADIQGGMTQKVGALAGTLEDVLNQAEPLVAKLNSSKFKILNDAFIAGKSQTNDPDVNELLPLINSAKGLYASVIASGGSAQKEDKELASESIGRGLNPAAFGGMKRAVTFEANSRIKRLGGAGYNEQAPPTKYTSAVDVKSAVQSGRLSKADAKQILQSQFGFK